MFKYKVIPNENKKFDSGLYSGYIVVLQLLCNVAKCLLQSVAKFNYNLLFNIAKSLQSVPILIYFLQSPCKVLQSPVITINN